MTPLALALGALVLLVGCDVHRAPPPQSAPSPDVGAISAQLQNAWGRCLNQSYQFTSTQTPDKNAAAEMAFLDCSSEEQDLASLPYSALLMPHLKAETKHVLIEEGHVPMVASP